MRKLGQTLIAFLISAVAYAGVGLAVFAVLVLGAIFGGSPSAPVPWTARGSGNALLDWPHHAATFASLAALVVCLPWPRPRVLGAVAALALAGWVGFFFSCRMVVAEDQLGLEGQPCAVSGNHHGFLRPGTHYPHPLSSQVRLVHRSSVAWVACRPPPGVPNTCPNSGYGPLDDGTP